ncbi:MAG: hypothetical protein V1647_05155, partial [Pseudomonadota bacterium]
MNTFRGKIRIFGSVFIFTVAALCLYLLYQVSYVGGINAQKKADYVLAIKDISAVKSYFEAYQFEVNKMISEPSKYSASGLSGTPLRKTVEIKLDAIGDDELKRIFKNYNVSAEAVLGVFADQSKVQNIEGINNFVEMLKVSSEGFSAQTDKMSAALETAINTSASDFDKNMSGMAMAVFIIAALCVAFVMLCFFYFRRSSIFIRKVSNAVLRMQNLNFNKSDISDAVPFINDEALFELSDRVTSLAGIVSDNMSWLKGHAKSLEDDAERGKLVATYMSSIMNSVDIGIMVTDNLLKVSFINSEFEKFWRIKRARIVDMDVDDLPFMRLVKGWKEALEKTLRIGSTNVVTAGDSKSRKSKALFSVAPLKSSDGKDVIGTITVMQKEIYGTVSKIQP